MAGPNEILLPERWQQPTMDQAARPWEADLDSYYNLKNLAVTDRGTLMIRPGFRSYFSEWYESDPILHTYDWRARSALYYTGVSRTASAGYGVTAFGDYQYGTYKHFWCIINRALYALVGNSWTANLDTSNLLVPGCDAVRFNRSLIFAPPNGGALSIWQGRTSQVKALASAPNGAYVSTHYNRLIVAGVPGEPDFWYASLAGDPSYWTIDPTTMDAGGFEGQIPGNREITAISPSHYSGFFIGTKDGVHRIEGRSPSEYQHATTSGTVGQLGHRTLKNVLNDILGWNDYGCHALSDTDRSGGVESAMMPNRVRKIFKQKVYRDPRKFFSIVDPINACYMTFMPSREQNYTFVMCFYYTKNAWTWWELPFIVRSASLLDNGHTPTIAIGDQFRNILYPAPGALTDYHKDYDYAINFELETQRIRLTDGLRAGTVNSIRVWHRPSKTGTIDVDIRTDGIVADRADTIADGIINLNTGRRAVISSTGFRLGTNKLSSDEDVVQSVITKGGSGSFARVVISGTAANSGELELYGVQVAAVGSGGAP